MNIRIEHWIIRYPHGDTDDEPRSSNAGGWPPFFRFRSDYRLVSFAHRCASFPYPIDLPGKKP